MSNDALLDDFLDAWDNETGEGRDMDAARAAADAYVAANPDTFARYETMSLETCVATIDAYRSAAEVFRERGLDDDAIEPEANKLLVDVWLLHHFQPQQIGGSAAPVVRITENG